MILLRHAQSAFNVTFSVTRVDPGIEDPALTALGRVQASALAEALRGRPLKRLIASPYTRALETATIVAQALDLPIVVEPLVGERAAFSCDVGTPGDELARRWPELSLDHLEHHWWPPLEESEAALHARCADFRHLMAAAPDWPHVGVVSHWGFIRGLTGASIQNAEMVAFDPTARPPTPVEADPVSC